MDYIQANDDAEEKMKKQPAYVIEYQTGIKSGKHHVNFFLCQLE